MPLNPQSVDSTKAINDSREMLLAKAAVRPQVLAANTIIRFNHVLGKLSLPEVVEALDQQVNQLQQGDMKVAAQTLASQAATLDNLFNALAVKALQAPGLDMQATILKLAMQAQRQCCQTYETLSAIKKPAAVTVVSQTNIGQAVQVNNGQTAHTQETNLENKLLEQTHGERLDFGAQTAAISDDTVVATLEKRNRAENPGRQS